MIKPTSLIEKVSPEKFILLIILTFALTNLNAQEMGRPSDAYPDEIEEPSEFDKWVGIIGGYAIVIGVLVGTGYLWGQYDLRKNRFLPLLKEIEELKKDNIYWREENDTSDLLETISAQQTEIKMLQMETRNLTEFKKIISSEYKLLNRNYQRQKLRISELESQLPNKP